MTRKVEGSNAVVTTRTGVNTSGAQPPMQERDGSARRSFRPAGSIVLLASLAASFLATSSAPTPLYAVYGRDWHLTAANTSVVFGVYALSLLAGLLVLGRLSDHIGRRPTLGAAIATQIVAMAVFATAEGLSGLLVGRVLQGLSTGAGLAAVGAALLDVDSRREPSPIPSHRPPAPRSGRWPRRWPCSSCRLRRASSTYCWRWC